MHSTTRSFSKVEAEGVNADRQREVELAAEAAEDLQRRLRAQGMDRRGAPAFTHLTARTGYSLRDGAIRPRELTAAARAAGMTHVAVTDRDGFYGAVRFAQAAAADGVTPVFGTDLALEPDQQRPGWEVTRAGRARITPASGGGHSAGKVSAGRAADPRASRPGSGPGWLEDDAARVVFLARTDAGYGDLCRAVSLAHGGSWRRGDLEDLDEDDDAAASTRRAAALGHRSSPHLPFDAVATATARDGAWVVLGVDSPVGRLLAAGRHDAAEEELRSWMDVAGRHAIVLGIRNHLTKDADRVIRATLELAEKLEVRAAAVNDVRYLRREDVVLADVLTCIRHQVPLTHLTPSRRRHLGRETAEAWFTSSAELAPRFAERPDLLASAHEVATSCDVDLRLGRLHVPRLTGMSPEVAAGELYRRCWQGVAERFPRVSPVIRERLERELAMVDRLALHDYFLAVGDIVSGIREMGIIAACRGSAAGSLVCYALRISDVDPVAHDLAFERFMNPYRDELPDIDVDVESARREEIYDLVIDLYGEDRTACVAMVETFQARMAIRETGKVLGFAKEEIDHLATSFTHARARDVRAAMGQLSELRGARLDESSLTLLFDLVERLDGFPRHMAMHPCGILLADTALLDRTPLQRSAQGFPMSQFDKDDVAALGLLKLDVLGVRMLSAMAHCREELARNRGIDLDVTEIPKEDPLTYDLLRSTHTIGVFQLESPGQRELIGRLQPEHFGDLITEISLFRPGPVKADMVTPFVLRRRGEEETIYPHPSLTAPLEQTHGVVVYHEQVMAVLSVLTGCDLSYADLLRRQLGDDRREPQVKAWVIGRATERGYGLDEIEGIWQKVAAFASFGFCKAHAAAFAVPTYRSAYLKAHYMPEFIAGLLTHDPGMYPRRVILEEARGFGVAVLGVDVNCSDAHSTAEIIDAGHAEHLLGIRGGSLPPGWTREDHRPVPPSGWDLGDAGDGWRHAVRVGFDHVKGISTNEVESLVDGRPYGSLADLRARSGLSRPSAVNLCKAGAMDVVSGLGRKDGPSHRRDVALVVEELWRTARAQQRRTGLAAEQIVLDLHADHVAQLPAPTEADVTRDELSVLGMDVSRHLISYYEPLLDALGVTRAVDLESCRNGERVRVAGVKTALQSPGQRSGSRVMFLSLDDRTGSTQVTYFSSVLDDVAWTVMHSWIFVAEGRVSRRGADWSRGRTRGATVTGRRAWNLSRLWRAWQEGWLEQALDEKGTPAPHQRDDARRPDGLQVSEWGRGSR